MEYRWNDSIFVYQVRYFLLLSECDFTFFQTSETIVWQCFQRFEKIFSRKCELILGTEYSEIEVTVGEKYSEKGETLII